MHFIHRRSDLETLPMHRTNCVYRQRHNHQSQSTLFSIYEVTVGLVVCLLYLELKTNPQQQFRYNVRYHTSRERSMAISLRPFNALFHAFDWNRTVTRPFLRPESFEPFNS